MTMLMRAMPRAIPLAALLTLAACSTILNGRTQEIGFQSQPTAAKLFVDGEARGSTPAVVALSRKRSHIVRLEMEGFQPFEATLVRSVSGWAWGNLVFGGLVGLAVDARTGALYKLSPDQVSAQIAAVAPGAVTRDGIFVRVVLRAEPAWERVGQLSTVSLEEPARLGGRDR